MEQPDEGWSHNTAALAVGQGVYYSFPVRYVGSIQVMESMRTLSMPDKTAVCWEAIARCCDAAGLRTKKQKKRKVAKIVQKFLADSPYVKVMELKINLSIEGIATSDLQSNEIISNDDIKKISFAAGGSQNEYDFITYVAKDKRDNRYCHVFDCSILADDVLATIGQIFNILTNSDQIDVAADAGKAVGAAAQLDNPLYHAMQQKAAPAGQSHGGGTVNAAYAEGDDGEAMYDEAGEPNYGEVDEEAGGQFADFLNANVASSPLYGELPTDDGGEALYDESNGPGWGYLDVKPDEDLYGGLADVFVDE